MKIYSPLLLAAAMMSTPLVTDAKKVHTIGDSTMQTYDESATVTRGWGQYLQQFFEGMTVNNRGKSGASSKSFYEEASFWTSVKKQLEPGDYVVIQFAHNDEKTNGMDGSELKEYYTKIGDTASASATDYRGTTPSGTYKEYLRKYVTETREAGCTPILCGPICRMYFSGNTIRRNGRHDLGDKFSKLTANGVLESQSVPADDHSMDYVYQMKQVAEEMDVPFVDLTTSTADLYLSYGDKDCHDILSDGDGSTHLSATGAALIARRFAQLCKDAGIMSDYISLKSELSVTPADADLGKGYKGQSMQREFMVTGFDLTPAAGSITITAGSSISLSSDGKEWTSSLSIPYEGSTVIEHFYVKATLEQDGVATETVTIDGGGKKTDITVKYEAVSLAGGQEASAYWRLEKDNECDVQGPIEIVPEFYSGMVLQRYSAPNANTTWPSWTDYEASRKTQRNVIEGEKWPGGEMDEVSTRYIDFAVKAMKDTKLNIDKISCFACGCGGNGMCVKVYYYTTDDYSDPHQIFEMKSMKANDMQYIESTPVVSLNEGEKLTLRFYPWYNGEATGKTLCLSDVTIHGYASSLTSIDVISADSATPVRTIYYSLDGTRVENPSKGFYIVASQYADGSTRTTKTIL